MNRYRHLFTRKNLTMIGVSSATAAAFFVWAQGNYRSSRSNALLGSSHESSFANGKWPTNPDLLRHAVSSTLLKSLNTEEDSYRDIRDDQSTRSFRTPADLFYKENKSIPLPSTVHATLEATTNQESKTDNNGDILTTQKNILVIGDVHGCYDELLELHAKAVSENGGFEFQFVILVGDLCNKGPHSAKVIRHARLNPGWLSVRGNHDDGALAAALGDPTRLKKKTYQWVRGSTSSGSNENSTDNIILSDDDVHWLSQLPYTLTIPGDLLGEEEDTLIVHAGLIPYCDIQDQEISTMTTIRNLIPRCNNSGEFTHFEYDNGNGDEAVAWASAWNGPQRVIFGHDARRKLQLHEGNWATGLDTGAVYGGELTGIILPERKLVSVKSKEYSPIGGKSKKPKIKEVGE